MIVRTRSERGIELKKRRKKKDLHAAHSRSRIFRSLVLCHLAMHLSAEQKHHILLEYKPYSYAHGFGSLAARHGVAGGGRTIQRWHERWDGTPQSLQHTDGAGRPRVLSSAQVALHLAPRIRAANRQHKAVHYPDVIAEVRTATGTSVSSSTLRRYGHNDLGARQRSTKKRTAKESKHIEHEIRCSAFAVFANAS
jgi:hypothetical protein